MVEPEYVEVAVRVIGEAMFSWLILPGRPAVEGVRLSLGRSIGGLGAGPGFINCPGVKFLKCPHMISGALSLEKVLYGLGDFGFEPLKRGHAEVNTMKGKFV